MPDYVLKVSVVIFSLSEDALQVLLTPTPDGQWEFPGQPWKTAESFEDTAKRAFSDQLKRREVYLEQLYTYGDPLHGTNPRSVSVVYFALIPADAHLNPPSGKMCWYCLDQLPSMSDNQDEILSYGLRRLRYKLEYTAVGFELLPDEFTLSELQHTYEIILGEKLDKRNFRRRILDAGIIEETPRRRSGEGRPARLYRYRPDAVAYVKARRLFP